MPTSFDALLVLSFGGPEGPDQVMPFLENVTRGRGIPPERLAAVAEHYLHFGGVSPINGINRALIDEIRAELADRGEHLPVYFGNRNWHPLVEDTVATMASDGVRRAAVFATSAWGGYSGCAQYQEDIVRARAAVGDGAPELVKLRQFFDHPLLVAMFADAIAAAAAALPEPLRADARLVFTAHSIPVRAADRCGPGLYARQVRYAAGLVAAAAGYSDYDVVWQSRSGPPQVPWLEPDVAEHLSALAESGCEAVLVCPVGFVSDHIEVVWDLDNELREQADQLGIALARASTLNAQRRFAQLVLDLLDAARDGRDPAKMVGAQPVPGYGSSVNGQLCTTECVVSARPSAGSR
ncbi:ferrochelatase [Mycobacterium sp. CVI_P3]|uniref:Coproporphyrin III ferrochelatase n=1 Tax=Mycobacterium pinniadriaticum TaxID=2994102 RepID=A0ABT3SB48_9MYCO|nr:ferrochelatase [Mycobacterium pinniadriaticum]MCX2930215.1 ferrochelatase [Mycobacterium pinniadriaticum]MCX2936723.1 ferrochelatase [Mycobacterium pinniadriaticum]